MLMTARMTHPAFVVPDAMDALQAVSKAVSRARIPISRELVHLRAGQINGCSVCVDMHAKGARKAGESEEKVFAVAAWRETPYFSDAERAALALTEALTRVADRAEPVPDEIWDAAAEHFDEVQLGGWSSTSRRRTSGTASTWRCASRSATRAGEALEAQQPVLDETGAVTALERIPPDQRLCPHRAPPETPQQREGRADDSIPRSAQLL
jgi:AhpD family alkylhydroperoxidase